MSYSLNAIQILFVLYLLERQIVVKKANLKAPKTDWARVDAMTDDDIDYSDSPEITQEMFKVMKKFEPTKKVLVNLRMDAEIVDFFKANSKQYQTKINEVLLTFVRGYKKAHHSH